MTTGPNQILLKRSDTVSSVPSGLSFGEPAINTASGKLFFQEQIDGTATGRMLSFHGFTNESFVTDVNGVTGSVNAVTSVGVSGGNICTDAKAVAFTSNTTGLTFETTCHGNTAHVSLNAEALRSFVPEALYNYTTISGTLNSPNATANGDFIFNPDNNKVSIFKRTALGVDYRDFLSNVASNGIGSIKFYSVSSQQQDVNEILFDQVTYDGDSFDFTAYQTFPDGVTGASGDQVSVSFHPVENRIAAASHFETPDGSTFDTVVTSFNGKTGTVEGVGSFNGATGAITTSGLHLHVAGLSTDGGISVGGVIDSTSGISVGGSTIGGVKLASGVVTATLFSGTATLALSASSATSATTATNVTVTAVNDSDFYHVPFAAGAAAGSAALGLKSDGGATNEGLYFQPDVATLSTGIANVTGVSLGASGITFSDGTQTTTALRTDSYTGQIETAADKTYTLDPKVATARTITGFYIKSASGTVTATLKNGSDTIKAASVSSSSGDQSSLANTSVSADAVLSIVTSSNSSALDVIFNVEYTAAL